MAKESSGKKQGKGKAVEGLTNAEVAARQAQDGASSASSARGARGPTSSNTGHGGASGARGPTSSNTGHGGASGASGPSVALGNSRQNFGGGVSLRDGYSPRVDTRSWKRVKEKDGKCAIL